LTEAQRNLVERYVPMAQLLAVKMDRPGVDREEYFSVANLALVEAAQSFDPGRNVSFASYARAGIVGALCDHRRFLLQNVTFDEPLECTPLGRRDRDDARRGLMPVVLQEGAQQVGIALENRDEVESFLRRLPRIHAEVCRMVYIEGRSQVEAAKALGCSKSYISRVLRDAIGWLREERRAGGEEVAPAAPGALPRPHCRPRGIGKGA
jgi:RNA polymerase sigma factor (sigma-70 family)